MIALDWQIVAVIVLTVCAASYTVRAFLRQFQHGLKVAEFCLDLTPLDEFALKRDFFPAGRCG